MTGMRLEITFLGTGSAFTDYRLNYHNNAVVWTREGPVLIDCGPTAMQSMREIGMNLHSVRDILVTHLHGDHIGGLEQLAWERFYTGGDSGSPSYSQTPVRSTQRILDDLRTSLWACMDEWTDEEGAHYEGYDRLFDPRPCMQDEAFTIGGVCFRLEWTPHVTLGTVDKPCFGIKVWLEDDPEQTFYFTSDSQFRSEIGELHPTGAIFHDCTFIPVHPGSVHSHYDELLTLPPEVKSRVVLMHHTVVPEHVSVSEDGFKDAAQRHDRFDWQGNRVE